MKRGGTSTRADSPPGFEGVLWPNDLEIDWLSAEPVAMSEDAARELVKNFPASMVQGAADAMAGGKSEIDAEYLRGCVGQRRRAIQGAVYENEYDEVAAAAEREGVSVSKYVRVVALAYARRALTAGTPGKET